MKTQSIRWCKGLSGPAIILASLSLLSLTGFSRVAMDRGTSFSKALPSNESGRTPQAAEPIEITPLDPDFSIEEFERDGYQVTRPTRPRPSIDGILSPDVRDRLLTKAGLLTRVEKWDHLERDILVVRTRQYGLEKLKTLYPQFPPAALLRLKELLKRHEVTQ